MAKWKRQTTIYKTLHWKLKIEQHEVTKHGAPEGYTATAAIVAPVMLLCGGMSIIRNGWNFDYDKRNISTVISTQIFHSCSPSHGGNRKASDVIAYPTWTYVSVASSLSGNAWQELQTLEYRVNLDMYVPNAVVAGMLVHKCARGGIWNHLVCR